MKSLTVPGARPLTHERRVRHVLEEIRAGEVVWIPPGLKHWHGAAPTTAMTRIATQEHVDGKSIEWMEKVNDEQYGR